MSKEIWAAVITAAVTIIITILAVTYHFGQVDDHVTMMDQRLERVESYAVDSNTRLSRLEGYLESQNGVIGK